MEEENKQTNPQQNPTEEETKPIDENQMKIYNNVLTILKEKRFLDVENALEELFLSEYEANGKEVGEILQQLSENKHRIHEVFGYNTFLLAVLHSLHQFQWKEHVETILTEVYQRTPPRDMFLFQKNIVKSTQDVPTLIHSLKEANW